MRKFYSNGKLLLTGEYVVLDGAKALALPTKKGQSLLVEINDSKKISWNSFDCHKNKWFTTEINISELTKEAPPKRTSKLDETLFKILWQAQQLNPNFLEKHLGYSIQTHLTFERLWGLGTSSTLINNIANWATVNPFELLNLSFGGSGYDIACAKIDTPIFYHKTADQNHPSIISIIYDPPFKNNLFFIYLNEKKDSKQAISAYRKLEKSKLQPIISKINQLTFDISECTSLTKFNTLITSHEILLSSLLKTPTVKQTRFPDFSGAIKSLGGWGGDFVLATGTKKEMEYFLKKGYTTIIPYSEMVL